MASRLGLDIGTNSIGWALLDLTDGKPSGVIRTGVRIFSDGRNPKDGSSLAVTRRLARQQRRMRDRKIKRQQRLLDALTQAGLMPVDPSAKKQLEAVDPLEIRAQALDVLVDPHHLGRALFHLSKRRGFKSNRKTDSGDSESGIIATSVATTKEQMEVDGARTYGEWLFIRKNRGEGVRARTTGSGAQKAYEVYSDRALTEQEIDLLFERQRSFGSPTCSEDNQSQIKDIILFQRDLLPFSPGKCTFEIDQPRGALAHPTVQAFRIYQELNNLRIINSDYSNRPLTLEERDKIAEKLEFEQKLTLTKIRKLLSLHEKEQINFESSRDFLIGNQTNVSFTKAIGKKWKELDENIRIQIVRWTLETDTDDELIAILKQESGLSDEEIQKIIVVRLVDGYGKLSIQAIDKILPHLKSEVITFDKAAALAGYDHSNKYSGECFPELPYYGQILQQYTGVPVSTSSNNDEATFGRIANPTVHIALNQVRKLVNRIIKKYGHPDEIHLEVVRDLKLSQKAKRELEKKQRENQKRNDIHRERLEELGQKDTFDNRLRLTLWEELAEQPMDRCCPFSGDRIGIESLFTAAVQIEHIIPFSDCLDDSQANKTLATRKANNDKGKRTPFEAFGDDQGGYSWQDICDRADRLPASKRRRFTPEARKIFSGDEWLARQLNDTAYISRVSRQYLTAICNPNKVRVVPGRLTALFRRALDLESLLGDGSGKDRTDHRHHAIDAVVVALTEAGLIKKASQFAANDAITRLSDRLRKMEPPWPNFGADVAHSISRIQVSYKPDHGVAAALHNDTAYGLVSGPDEKGASMIRYRKSIADLKEKDLDKILDSYLANKIREFINTSIEPFDKAIIAFSQQSRAKKCTVEEKLTVIPISDREGNAYKAYKGDGNYCYEIVWVNKEKWGGRIISNFEANQTPYQSFMNDPGSRRYSFDGNPLAMRITKDDIIALTEEKGRALYRVVVISSGTITLAPLQEANVDARNRAKDDPFKYVYKTPGSLKSGEARRVFVDLIGTVKDPGRPTCPEELLK